MFKSKWSKHVNAVTFVLQYVTVYIIIVNINLIIYKKIIQINYFIFST